MLHHGSFALAESFQGSCKGTIERSEPPIRGQGVRPGLFISLLSSGCVSERHAPTRSPPHTRCNWLTSSSCSWNSNWDKKAVSASGLGSPTL